MKKLLLLLLGVLIAFPLIARDFEYTYEGQTITYTVIDEEAKTCMTKEGCTEYAGNEVSGYLILPDKPQDGNTEFTLTAIGDWAFSSCRGLTSITIPSSVLEICFRAFTGCTGLTSVTIPNSVIRIGDYALWHCSGLTSVTIPNSVTSIGNCTFANCSGLTTVTIPNSVTTIGNSAFASCSSLTSIIVEVGDENYSSENGVLFNKNKSSLICYPGGKTGPYTIPNSVTSIGNDAFDDCTGLTSVTIPNSVTSIGQDAFEGCSGLTSVTIPNSVTEIGDYAFLGCTGLTSVTIPNSVTEIGNMAFSDCRSLTSITIPNSVTSMGEGAFTYCSGLQSVVISNSVTEIGDYMFRACISLASVNIPNSVTMIGVRAFDGCSSLTSITIPNTVTEIGNFAFSGCSGLTSVTIPNSVTEIGDYAFYGCSGLTSVAIPNSVTSIGNSAFSGCSGLTSVAIPNSVTSIGNYAFDGCSNLTAITVSEGNQSYSSENGVLFNKNKSVLITYPEGKAGSYIIPDSVTSIVSGAFIGCSGLISVIIPNSVTSIGYSAFSGCSGLTSVTISESVTTIDPSAFYGCSGLTLVTIPSSVTEIGNYAFSGCSGLTSINIPNSVTEIGNFAFRGCCSLNYVLCDAENPPIISSTTFHDALLQILFVPTHSIEFYCQAEDWKNFAVITSLTQFDLIKAGSLINQVDIAKIDKITHLKLSGLINGTDMLTLNKMKNLEWLDLSEATIVSGGMNYYEEDNTKYGTKDNTLGNYWAYALDKLETVYLPENLTTIGDNAFSGKSNIKSLTIPGSVIAIGNNAFSGCSELTSMSIPASVMAIGNNAFANCPKLTDLRLDDGDLELFVGDGMLANTPIESLHLGRNVEYQNSPFREHRNLTKLTIGNNVTSIKWGAFYRCNGLESVEIPNSVTEIGNSAFGECSGLNSVVLPLGLTDISVGMFSYCGKLSTITIPGGVRYIRSKAFKGCSALKRVNMINPIPAVIDEDSFDFTATLNVPEESKVYYWLHPLWSKFPNLQAWNVGTDIDFVTEDGNSTTFHITSEESATVEVTAATLLSRAPGELTIPETVTYNGKVYTVAGIANNAFHDMAFEAIELPKTIAYVGLNAFSGCSELKTLRVNALLPPSAARESFDDNVFASTTLIVPDDAVDAYRDHDIWKLFNTIENAEIDEIDAPATEAPKQVYDMRGVRVGDSLEGLPHGVYIIRQGSKTTKHAI